MQTMNDLIEKRIIALFKGIDLAAEALKPEEHRLTIKWERAEPYAIDDAARKTSAAMGLVDQGQKFGKKTSIATISWGMAVEFFVQVGSTGDIKTKVNAARREIFMFMVNQVEFDPVLMDLVDDITPIADDVYVDRGRRYGEGVVTFMIEFRSQPNDIGIPVDGPYLG